MHHTHLTKVSELFDNVTEHACVKHVIRYESFFAGRFASGLQGLSPIEMDQWIEIALRFAEEIGIFGARY